MQSPDATSLLVLFATPPAAAGAGRAAPGADAAMFAALLDQSQGQTPLASALPPDVLLDAAAAPRDAPNASTDPAASKREPACDAAAAAAHDASTPPGSTALSEFLAQLMSTRPGPAAAEPVARAGPPAPAVADSATVDTNASDVIPTPKRATVPQRDAATPLRRGEADGKRSRPVARTDTPVELPSDEPTPAPATDELVAARTPHEPAAADPANAPIVMAALAPAHTPAPTLAPVAAARAVPATPAPERRITLETARARSAPPGAPPESAPSTDERVVARGPHAATADAPLPTPAAIDIRPDTARDKPEFLGAASEPRAHAASVDAAASPQALPLAAMAPLSTAGTSPVFSLTTPERVALHEPVISPHFAEALGVQVSVLAREGVQHAELHLNPAEMGPLSVQIALDGQQAQVHFGSDSAQTRQIVETGLPALAAALREAGLTLSGGGVSQHAPGQRQGSKPGPTSPGRAVSGTAAVVQTVQRSVRLAVGRLDTYA